MNKCFFHEDIHKQAETKYLKKRDREQQFLPTESQTDDPDCKGPTTVSQRAGCRADVSRNAESKVIE